ncbi:MAG: YajQ family cyclic di-GMP-binding protein [Acidobacteriota bacterium]
MAANESFDITTGCDLQEVDNAVNQAMKEIHQRYDFKGIKVKIEFKKEDNKIILNAPDDYKLKAVNEILKTKMIRRNVPVKNLKEGTPETALGGSMRLELELQQGIPTDTAKKIVKFLKDKKMRKVQASIQKDQVRVSSPSRDELQKVMGFLKEEDFGVELNFGNYRSS